eukprot:4907994-Pleurochrysis_carterae.AAC.1
MPLFLASRPVYTQAPLGVQHEQRQGKRVAYLARATANGAAAAATRRSRRGQQHAIQAGDDVAGVNRQVATCGLVPVCSRHAFAC